ncbi:MAG TPA: hypothetical protein VIW69_10225 [Candidatus Elarobacter sp.]
MLQWTAGLIDAAPSRPSYFHSGDAIVIKVRRISPTLSGRPLTAASATYCCCPLDHLIDDTPIRAGSYSRTGVGNAMSLYLSYMKAMSADLGQVAVWEPGSAVELGDYGELKNRRWEYLGSIWDRIPADQRERLRETTSAKLDWLTLGSATVTNANANAKAGGAFGISVEFKRNGAVLLRAQECETRSLRRVQEIAEQLALGEWKSRWMFVSEVRGAKRFLILIGRRPGASVKVTAETSEVLDAFGVGGVSATTGIEISGSDVLQFLGNNGAIHMSLMQISGPGLFAGGTEVKRRHFARGEHHAPLPEVYVDSVDAETFVRSLVDDAERSGGDS